MISTLEKLYDDVFDIINNHKDYHCSYYCDSKSADWSKDGSYVSFDVHGYSDQGCGSEWTEYWCIYNDGKILRDSEWYNTFNDFKNDWL